MADIISKIVDSIFDIKKVQFYLLGIFILGFILRLIAAINISPNADDMIHALRPINFLAADRMTTYDQSSGLWYAFSSVIYSILGATNLASRTAALIFGTFSILVIFLLTKEFFSEKIALISAFLLAIAPFHIKNTYAEVDVMAMFFVMFGMLLFVKALKSKKTSLFFVAGLLIGLAVYSKAYPLLFIPSLLAYAAYYSWKSEKKIIYVPYLKKIFVFLVVIFIFTIPVLTYNYLLYKDKGFLDLQFTRTIGLGKEKASEYYSWDPIFDKSNSWAGLFLGDSRHIADGTPLLLGAINFIRNGDPINFYLGLLGIGIIVFRRKEHYNYLVFFLLSTSLILVFLASIILLPKHFIFLELLMVPLSALALENIGKKTNKYLKRYNWKIIVIFILMLSLISLSTIKTGNIHFYAKSAVAQVMDFKEKDISKTDLIVADNRIFVGRLNWMFYGKTYIDGIDFIKFVNLGPELSGNQIPVDVFYFECVNDDCGWGMEKITMELNNSMEELTEFFKANGENVKTIYEPSYANYYPLISEKEAAVNIYKKRLLLKEDIFNLANQPKYVHLNTLGYLPADKQFDYYETNGFFDKSLDKVAHWVVLISVLLAFLSLLFAAYLVLTNKPGPTKDNYRKSL